jgi:hypothetical protein
LAFAVVQAACTADRQLLAEIVAILYFNFAPPSVVDHCLSCGCGGLLLQGFLEDASDGQTQHPFDSAQAPASAVEESVFAIFARLSRATREQVQHTRLPEVQRINIVTDKGLAFPTMGFFPVAFFFEAVGHAQL